MVRAQTATAPSREQRRDIAPSPTLRATKICSTRLYPMKKARNPERENALDPELEKFMDEGMHNDVVDEHGNPLPPGPIGADAKD